MLRKHIALPSDHGSWVFLLSPLLIGLFIGGRWTVASIFLIIAALAAFLMRQPLGIIVKVYSGRRSRRDLPSAWFWVVVYASISLLAVIGLILQGFAYLLMLAIPGIFVFSWHMYLISKRAERRQAGVEVVASGVLALTAPAAYWIGIGTYNLTGWLLWILIWAQSAASIVYAYLRLEQRQLTSVPDKQKRLKMGRRSLLYSTFNLITTFMLSLLRITPPLLPLAYMVQWLETLWGLFKPAIGVKPTLIGLRQLAISTIYTLLFIVTWYF
jgi:hypothetical protein